MNRINWQYAVRDLFFDMGERIWKLTDTGPKKSSNRIKMTAMKPTVL